MGRPVGSKNKDDLALDECDLTKAVVSNGVNFVTTEAANRGIPVKTAFLHQALTWPGVAGAEKTISEAKIKGVKIYWAPQGLILECKGQTCIVPHANVANAILV